MNRLCSLIARNCKVYFRDKSIFFSSLIAPLVLLFLYIAFLSTTYQDTLANMLQNSFSVTLDQSIANAFAGGWLLSSLVAVSAVSIAFTANVVMVQDNVTGRIDDFSVSPVPKSMLALGYYLSTALVTLAICFLALLVGFIYLGIVGWYLSVSDVFLVILDTFLLVMFGTALSAIFCSLIKSQGGVTAVEVIVSASYGFLCGAYMPFSQLANWISSVLKFLPGTYGTVLLHEHLMGSAIDRMPDLPGLRGAVRSLFDCELDFFGHTVAPWVSNLVIILTVVLLVGAYILFLSLRWRKRKKEKKL